MSLNDIQKSKLMMTVFVGVVCMIMIGFFHFMFGLKWVAQNERMRADVEKKLVSAEADLKQINDLVNQQKELERQSEMIKKVTQRLPSSQDAPGFLNALFTTLSTTGIVQEEVKPSSTEARALYTEIPYAIQAHGRYHAIGQFLTLIEQNPERFMRVKNLQIVNDADRPSIHPIKMDVTTFMFNQ
ncbi:type 4a pilus biogenesis protein PilO [bacterium]|nr:type 4a pilus biogenesis protein PilO [bacterium]